MRTLLRVTLALVLVLVTASSFRLTASLQPVAQAATTSQLEQQKAQLEAEAKRKAALAASEAAQAKQVAAQIDNAANQISQLEGSISSTEDQISTTQQQIADQNQQVAGLESSLRDIKDKQDAVVRAMFELAIGMPDALVLLSNQSVSDRARYEAQYTALKKSVAQLFTVTTEKKMAVEKVRADLQAHADELSHLRDQQSEQRTGLATFESIQEEAKLNHDAAVKKYTAEAKAANAQIARIEEQLSAAFGNAITTTGPHGTGQHVVRGQYIGARGSTGNSTGPHVHFEVRIGNTPVDPGPYVSNGTLIWPVSNFVITQGFGYTDYANGGAYGGAPHTGYDLAGPQGDPVVASCDGYVILQQYYGGYGNAWAEKCDNSNISVLDGHLAHF